MTSRTDAALVGVACLGLAAGPFLPSVAPLVLAAVTVAGWRRYSPAVTHLALLGGLTLALASVPELRVAWPVPVLLAIAVHWIAIRPVPWLTGTTEWVRRGHIDRTTLGLIVGFSAAASVALVSWTAVADPDLVDLLARIPDAPVGALVLVGIVFACANAFAEEWLFRGVMMQALDKVLGAGAWTVVIQAVVFGVMHIEGFPRGWAGVGLATVYGAMMGVIRRQSGGLLAPWIAHVVADITIFAVLAVLAGA